VGLKRTALLEPCRITRYATDDWGTSTRLRNVTVHHPGKGNAQHIEPKHVMLRMRLTRFTGKPTGFPASIPTYDLVLGLCFHRSA
jgi:IS1 family transposase